MKKISEKIVFDGNWLFIEETVCENKQGKCITWETVKRKHATVGVVVVAKLMPSKRFVLIKQYRPSVHGYVLGFPAGLSFDQPEQALVELKEETGYTGKILAVSPSLKTGSSLINDSGRVITVEVDEQDPVNQNPKQQLEDAEDIEVFLVKKEDVLDFVKKENEKGAYISSNLWYMFGLVDVLNP